jgi:transposase
MPGPAHELAPSPPLLKCLPKAPACATEHAREGLADMACDAKTFRSAAREMGAMPVAPSRKNAKQPEPCRACICRHRNLIERCWSRLKEYRVIVIRYDKPPHPMPRATLSVPHSTCLNLHADQYSDANRPQPVDVE